jgi:hypothetical protein
MLAEQFDRAHRVSAGDGRQGSMKPEGSRRASDNMGKTKYHFACMLQRETESPVQSLITLGIDLYRLRHGPAGPPRKKFHRAGILSDGSDMPELNLRALFEEYHAQVGG